jgi:hypothetical protein
MAALLADIETLEPAEDAGPMAAGDDLTPSPALVTPAMYPSGRGFQLASYTPTDAGGWHGFDGLIGTGNGGDGGSGRVGGHGGRGGDPPGGGPPGGGPPGGGPPGGSLPGAPEPATWTMMLVGLGAVGGLARARRTRIILSA